MDRVTEFQGNYRFLSNFWKCPIEYEGVLYPTVEHAYQAAKTTIPGERKTIREAVSPGVAKKLGRKVTLRANWEQVKLSTMLDLLRLKFADPYLRAKLLNTLTAELIEGNYWGDRYWGVCDGRGENHLGRLLMQVRDEVRHA